MEGTASTPCPSTALDEEYAGWLHLYEHRVRAAAPCIRDRVPSYHSQTYASGRPRDHACRYTRGSKALLQATSAGPAKLPAGSETEIACCRCHIARVGTR
jgi:hypothetical protein